MRFLKLLQLGMCLILGLYHKSQDFHFKAVFVFFNSTLAQETEFFSFSPTQIIAMGPPKKNDRTPRERRPRLYKLPSKGENSSNIFGF